jgi:aspartate/methionine/tyrosine aminotransferase
VTVSISGASAAIEWCWIVIINPNNPTGAVYSKELLQEIVEIARQHNLIIFADEIYGSSTVR